MTRSEWSRIGELFQLSPTIRPEILSAMGLLASGISENNEQGGLPAQ
jgi:hypothetical protein